MSNCLCTQYAFFQEQKKSLSHVRVNVCWYMFAGPYNVTATRTPQSIKKEMVHLFCINLTHSTIRLMQPTLLHTFKTAVFICWQIPSLYCYPTCFPEALLLSLVYPIMSESYFSRQILIKFTGQLTLGQNGIPLFFIA